MGGAAASLQGDRHCGRQAANCDMQAKYDFLNPAAMKRLAANGAKFQAVFAEILEACFNAAKDTYAEISATNAAFKKVHDSMVAFRADEYLWFQLSEYTFDTFMMGPAAQEGLVAAAAIRIEARSQRKPSCLVRRQCRVVNDGREGFLVCPDRQRTVRDPARDTLTP